MLEDLTPPVREFPCGLREIMSTLDESDQVILKDALANREIWSNLGLAKALTAKGLPAGERLIRERRDKPCNNCVCR
jgi:hypothetical protein